MCACKCVHVCVCTVSGKGRESKAEVGGAAVRLPQSCQQRREPRWPLTSTSEPGHQATGKPVRAWSWPRPELMINQPWEAAQQLRPASRRAQTQRGSGAGSRGRWRPLCSPTGCGRRRRPAGPASEEPGAAIWCPLSYRAGHRYGALDGQVRADEQALSTDLGLATGGSEPPLAFHFLGEFSELSGLGGNRTGVWRAQKAVGAGWWSSGRAPCPPTAIFPVMMSVLQKHGRSEISPDPTSPWPPKHPSRGSGQDTGVVLPASRVPGPGGLKWAPTLGWRHLWQTP